jgi:NAD(P)-dependent dehydrogenase (short-subunit alcohol dehydrogenase family)
MKGKVVIITGANGGLGRSVTGAFLDAGAAVVGTSIAIKQSDFAPLGFTAIPASVATHRGASELIDQVLKKFGQLHVLVHTVGGFAGGCSVAETDDATMQKMMDMNFNSLFQVARAAIPALRATGDGRLIAIGSRAAVDPGPCVGATAHRRQRWFLLSGQSRWKIVTRVSEPMRFCPAPSILLRIAPPCQKRIFLHGCSLLQSPV